MKTLLLSAVALATVSGLAPAAAQAAPESGHHAMAMKPMTRAELTQKVQAHFARVDTNHDGFVTKAEMDAAVQSMHSRMEQRRFDHLDANDDGSVSRREFDAAHAQHQQQAKAHPRMRGMVHAGMAEQMFAAADANNDGRLSLAEATAAATAHFDKADANHDGTLSVDEMRAAHQAMGAKPGRS
jgi:Ca2+-binding EF-hand superfamily protein